MLVDVAFFLCSGDGLIERQVDLIRLVDLPFANLGHCRFERLEVVHACLVDENVTVSQEENPLLRAGPPKPPDDLKGRVGLSCPRGHDEQDTVLSFRYGLNGPVYRDLLIVAGVLAAHISMVILRNDGLCLW